ncbi:iron-containing alcohol dehydrogenase family protein [Paenibacillus radicis (ex Gao et al. 2016)]|uniref:Oxidoreductase n=1 Tax=Paenibacillus radicis (ex Gao et al. 2016) TaxID=1737354 RepID=A0A917H6T4_9BACL|nr:iron-containing alcohol dehydrogenase family protein [Paenibacillus radicis (ex Gao et al. 2016)]GGG68461.1 oxidoreductase [Paenibacillus radicis (ex Gao et al. 2016)]
MLHVKAPNHYWNESGIVRKSGSKLKELGVQAFIISGKTAWNQLSEQVTAVLHEQEIRYTHQEFSGSCTQAKINTLAEKAKGTASFIIGIGGGSALDTAKAAAEQAGIPVVTIPTIAATCAGWSALTVLYDEEGRSSGYLPLKQSPQFVLADSEILAAAPARFLAAGLADTIVKWYETAIHITPGATGALDARIGVRTAELALEIIREYGVAVYEAVLQGEKHSAFIDVTDAILALAGLVGSVAGEGGRGGFAHIIHDSLTWVPETHHSLHGEKVGFGLIAQLFLEGKREEAESLSAFLNRLNLPITLEQLGIWDNAGEQIERIAAKIQLQEAFLAKLSFPVNKELLAQAIHDADQLGQQVREAAFHLNE